jgi:hypothetical protein
MSSQAKKHIEMELLALGYKAGKGNVMVKGNKVVTFSCSTGFDAEEMVVFWKEHWDNNYAHIYDYSSVGGPTCITPIKTLFDSQFIKMKKNLPSHDNNPYYHKGKQYFWWRQRVKKEHELAKLILSFKDKWNLLV